LKMKITATFFLLASTAVVLLYPGLSEPFVLVIFGLYLVFGISRSASRKLDPFNDVPNAFRVLLAVVSPVLAVRLPQPFGFASAVLAFGGALLLNDEYQRRSLDSVRKGRSGGSVALLGIDGSGKSTHTEELESWFRGRGYYCTRVPFHRYLFVERLSRGRRSQGTGGERSGGNPLRPLVSAIDNLILYLLTSFGRGLEGRVVLYDRYIWSTYVKYQALGYPVRPLRWLYMLPRPKFALVLDVSVEKSLGVIQGRPDHIRYRGEVLSEERDEYVRIARSFNLPLIDASRESKVVQRDLERRLSSVFPDRGA
jgi:thymidylate kinase